jgi:uncharacterized protein (TIGR03437 family)
MPTLRRLVTCFIMMTLGKLRLCFNMMTSWRLGFRYIMMTLRSFALCFILGASASAPALHAQFLLTFQGPSIVSQDPTVTFFDPATMEPGTTLSVPGAFQFLSLADGSELYLITNNTGAAITVMHPRSKSAIASAHAIGNFPNPLNCGALSPDGSRLVVGENAVHIFDTGTNVDLTPNGLVLGNGAPIVGVAVSYDSSTAYALATYNGNSYLAAINMAQLAVTSTLNIAGSATALALGPNALLYVSAPSQILEINPATMAATPGGTIAVDATPGKLVFTPDGNYALGANQTYGTQPAIVLLNLNNHLIEGSVPFTGLTALESSPLTGQPAVFDSLYVASAATVYAYSSGAQTLYAAQIGTNGGLALEIPVIANVTISAVAAMTVSNDLGSPAYLNALGNQVPARNFPQYLFAVSNGALDPASATGLDNLYRIDPASSLLTQQIPLNSTTPGAVAYYSPTFTNNTPVAALMYGNNQTLMPGATALPLVLRVVDQNGLPISGTSVNFTVGTGAAAGLSNASVTPVNTVTGADGYAEAIFTAGSGPADIGAISVTASVDAGAVTETYTMNVATAPATTSTLTIVSGQGQVILANPLNGQLGTAAPFTVLATASNGTPVPNALVTFTITVGAGSLAGPNGSQSAVVVPTDSTGQASITFLPVVLGQAATVTATAPTGATDANGNPVIATQTFYITTLFSEILNCSAPGCNPLFSPLTARLLQPPPGTVFTGVAGSTLPNPVVVQVYSVYGQPVPNVAVNVSTGSNVNLPNTSCAGSGGGVALTNAQGLATCNVVLNGVPGTGPLTISVPEAGLGNGSGLVFGPYILTILPGAPANIKILAGNNQVVNTNTNVPAPFLVVVTDNLNNPIPGIPVTWKVLSGSMILTGASATTSVNGEATASGEVLSPGGTTITLQVTIGSVSATFTVLVSVPAASIKVVSGNNQSALINTALSAPLVVQVEDTAGNPASFTPVVFTANGLQTLSATTVTAGVNGQASVTVTSAGPVAGTFKVSAIIGAGKNPPTATFTLTTLPLGPLGPAILNAASFAPGIAPGGLVTFIGPGLTPTIQGVVTDPSEMAGYSVSFDGIPAPILALINQNGVEQINAQVPFEEIPGPSDNITIGTPQGSASISNITVDTFAPGIFIYGTLTAFGQNYALAQAVRPDGSYVGASNPAQRGENITFFATGLGQTVPAASDGVPGVPGQIVGGTLYAGVNNQGDLVVSAIYQPNAVGVYAVTIQIPPNTLQGPAQPLGLLMVDVNGNAYSAQPAYLPIQ